MKRIMRRFVIKEISGCDKPAQIHARAVIMKRDASDDVEGKPGFGDGVAAGDARARLRIAYENMKRSYPRLDDDTHLGWAWRSLSRSEQRAILEQDVDDSSDPTFKQGTTPISYDTVDIAALAQIALEGRATALQKSQPHLTREAAFSMAVEQHADVFNAGRAAKRADMAKGNAVPDEAVVAKRGAAFVELHKRAVELLRADPSLKTIERARTEARRLNPALANLERA
jgi:hypothetical protein